MTVAIILAGGLGSRLKSKVKDRPKPMAIINGKPFLVYLIDYLVNHGINHIHLSVGYMNEKITTYFGSNYKSVNITYSIEEEKLGTGGGLKLSLQDLHLSEDFLLLNGDSFFNINLNELINFHKKKDSFMTLSLFKFSEPKRYGEIIFDKNNSVECIKEKSVSQNGFANAGIYVLNPNIKDILDKFYKKTFSIEDDLINKLIDEKYSIKAMMSKEKFIDIGIPNDYIIAREFFKNLDKG